MTFSTSKDAFQEGNLPVFSSDAAQTILLGHSERIRAGGERIANRGGRTAVGHVGVRMTPRRYASLPCGHFNFESAVTAQNDEFKAVLIARIHARQTSKI